MKFRVLGLAGAMSLMLLAPGAGVAADTAQSSATAQRDGAHDFDFNIGTWHTHIRRILDPLAGKGDALELDGTVTVWGGRAQLEEIEADGPNGHWEGLTLFLYNPAAHQWSQTFVDSKMGELNPSAIGSFSNGRGELIAQDAFKGRAVLVRGVWSDIKPESHQYEESYSNDGGTTWVRSSIVNLTKLKQ